MNGGQWSYTPQNPLFSGYNFLSSNLNVVFKRRCKEITHCWVLDFLESRICFKKYFKMSMTSYTSFHQKYCFTAILQSLWCFRTLHFLFSRGIDNTADTGKYTCQKSFCFVVLKDHAENTHTHSGPASDATMPSSGISGRNQSFTDQSAFISRMLACNGQQQLNL